LLFFGIVTASHAAVTRASGGIWKSRSKCARECAASPTLAVGQPGEHQRHSSDPTKHGKPPVPSSPSA
jgi:hypothetical protein